MRVILTIREPQSWIDPKGRLRSALDQFSLLEPSVRQSPSVGLDSPLVPWEVGFLGLGDMAPSFSKPQTVPSEEMPDLEAFALGYVLAEEVNQALIPFWAHLISLILENVHTRFFARDRLAIVSGMSRDFDEAVKEVFPSGTLVERSPTHPYLTAGVSANHLVELARLWWPSALGFFGGVAFAPGVSPEIDQAVAQTASVSKHEAASMNVLVQTIRSYDNAGVAVLSEPAHKAKVIARLAESGWHSGRIIELA